jgi:Holliday junction resolvase
MSKMQRDKGKRFEREVVNTLKESDAMSYTIVVAATADEGFKGDVLIKRKETSKLLLGNFVFDADIPTEKRHYN